MDEIRDVVFVYSLQCAECDAERPSMIDEEHGLLFCSKQCGNRFEKSNDRGGNAISAQVNVAAEEKVETIASSSSIDYRVLYINESDALPTIVCAIGRAAPGGARKWIKGAIKHPGALRAAAHRMGLLHGKKDKLSASDLAKLEAHAHATKNTTLLKRVNLARTLKRMHGGGGRGGKPSAEQFQQNV